MSNDYHIIEIIAMTLTVIDYYLQLVQILLLVLVLVLVLQLILLIFTKKCHIQLLDPGVKLNVNVSWTFFNSSLRLRLRVRVKLFNIMINFKTLESEFSSN